MDQQEFKRTLQQINRHACCYEKALLARRCACPQAHHFNLAEREGVACDAPEARLRCNALMRQLRQQTPFLFKQPAEQPLTHAQEIKLQLGGLQGLWHQLHDSPKTTPIIEDIAELLMRAEAAWGAIGKIPLQGIINHIAAFRLRHRNCDD